MGLLWKAADEKRYFAVYYLNSEVGVAPAKTKQNSRVSMKKQKWSLQRHFIYWEAVSIARQQRATHLHGSMVELIDK